MYKPFELKNIENALRRWKAQVTRVQDEVNIENLLKNDLVRQLNEQDCYWSKNEALVKYVFQQQNNQDAECFKKIKNELEERFFDNGIITIQNILKHFELNEEPYGYEFVISYENHVFQLFIPINCNININNLDHAAYGEFVVYAVSGTRHDVAHSYDEDVICNAIRHYVEEHVEE